MRILYEDKHGKYKDVPITDIQLTTLMANCAMAIVQYCIVRPKFMRYIRKNTANFEHLYENKHFVATVCSFPIAQQKEAELVMAYLLLSDSVEYRNFLRTNMNRIFIQIVEASEDDDLIYFSNTLPPKVSNLDSVYYAAFCFWYLYLTQDNPDTGILFDNKEYPMIVLQYLVDRFNYYPNISNGGLDGIKAPHIIDKLAYGSTQRTITVAHPELEDYLNLFRHVISKLCKPSHNYEAVPLSDEMVNMINHQYDYFYNEVSDKDNRIYLLVKNMIAYIAPLIDDFNLLQDRYYKDTAPHEYIADKLSKKLYATEKETARLQDEIARLQDKLDEANKANAQLAKLQEKVSWLEDENRFLQDRISESQIIYAPQETPHDIQAFIDRMNTHKIGLVGGNDDWQSKVSAVFNVHTAVTEMNKVDSLKNCDIVIVNTAFISHSMYFAVQKTAQNALFMYIDNLNMDTIATLLYHKYDKVVL